MKSSLHRSFGLALLCATLGLAHTGTAATPLPLPRSTPERQGVASTDLAEFIDALDRIDGMHSVMVVRRGKVIAEGWWAPYDSASNHELYSLSKSFTSTAAGFAIAEGKLSLDDEVLKFFPEDAPPEPANNLKAMRVRDLLTMSTGHQDEIASAPDKISAKAFLAHPVPHKPGTHFRYNTPATFMVSAIVQKQTGQTVLDYLRPRLFEPLGIAHPVWNTNSQGITLGGYGLSVRTEDIARFGQFYLQKGKWQGKQVLPAEWVGLATSRQVSNGSNPGSDWDQGYGFQFWRCRHDAYRGDGAFGQYCIVMPEQEAVLAITSGVKDMQAVLNVVWEKLLPAFRKSRISSDRASQQALTAKLTRLMVKTVDGAPAPIAATNAAAPVGHLWRRFVFPKNDQGFESIQLLPSAARDGDHLSVTANGRQSIFHAKLNAWAMSKGSVGNYADVPVASCGAWTGKDTFTLKLCAVETPYHFTWKLRFAGDEVTLDIETNVGFGGTKRPQLLGRAELK